MEENPFAGLAGKRDAIERREADRLISHVEANREVWNRLSPMVEKVLVNMRLALFPHLKFETLGENDLGLYSDDGDGVREVMVTLNPNSPEPSFMCIRGKGGPGMWTTTKTVTPAELIAALIELYPEWH